MNTDILNTEIILENERAHCNTMINISFLSLISFNLCAQNYTITPNSIGSISLCLDTLGIKERHLSTLKVDMDGFVVFSKKYGTGGCTIDAHISVVDSITVHRIQTDCSKYKAANGVSPIMKLDSLLHLENNLKYWIDLADPHPITIYSRIGGIEINYYLDEFTENKIHDIGGDEDTEVSDLKTFTDLLNFSGSQAKDAYVYSIQIEDTFGCGVE
ncbi:MAG: hypothetical protein HRT71_16260 [Flavobacteriales bacterium]|nr:hypothetical protein [Flavobacteriales bacterium]